MISPVTTTPRMDGDGLGILEMGRKVGIVGRLGVHPMVRLSLPARRIVAYLALKHEPVSLGVVAADLWPDVPAALARANLHQGLWQLPKGQIAQVVGVNDLERGTPVPRPYWSCRSPKAPLRRIGRDSRRRGAGAVKAFFARRRRGPRSALGMGREQSRRDPNQGHERPGRSVGCRKRPCARTRTSRDG
jgi:hypothetical protein